MNFIKLFAASLAVLGVVVTAPAVHAHATYNVGPGATPTWVNGAPAEWLAPTATVPSIGYLGIHGIANKRVIQTGQYNYAYAATGPTTSATGTTTGPAGATTTDLGGVFGGATPVVGDSLLGQTYKYNVSNPATNSLTDLPLQSISVGQNSWAAGVSDANTGLSWGNPHFSTGAGTNLEANLKATVPYVNVTLGDDPSFAGSNQLAFSLYQGWAKGPGLTGLNLLYTGLASAIGQDLGVTIALSGNTLNGPGTSGEYTIVVGDQSTLLTNPGFDGHYRLALEASATARYADVVSAVPVPGAVWLFGSALAGLIGYGRRKAAIAA
ncbi:MAG: hypothetical protein ABL919_05130 [Methylococcales bacterium]